MPARRPLIVDDLPLSDPSDIGQTGAHHGYRQVTLYAGGQPTEHAARFADLLADYEPIWDAWVSWIDPGGFVVRHVDAGPHRERWQVPIQPSGTLNDVYSTEPFRVDQWNPHEVRNPGPGPRVHVVIDRDVIVRPERTRFRTLED